MNFSADISSCSNFTASNASISASTSTSCPTTAVRAQRGSISRSKGRGRGEALSRYDRFGSLVMSRYDQEATPGLEGKGLLTSIDH